MDHSLSLREEGQTTGHHRPRPHYDLGAQLNYQEHRPEPRAWRFISAMQGLYLEEGFVVGGGRLEKREMEKQRHNGKYILVEKQ